MESSEHFPDKKHFFERCATTLKPGGTLAVCAWLRRDGAMPPDEKKLVAIIAEAMICQGFTFNAGGLFEWRHGV
jgi:2-polyprenyl-3-methyl-5-hydroxy-6-metoxy-1,4-benzoquinol methylase